MPPAAAPGSPPAANGQLANLTEIPRPRRRMTATEMRAITDEMLLEECKRVLGMLEPIPAGQQPEFQRLPQQQQCQQQQDDKDIEKQEPPPSASMELDYLFHGAPGLACAPQANDINTAQPPPPAAAEEDAGAAAGPSTAAPPPPVENVDFGFDFQAFLKSMK